MSQDAKGEKPKGSSSEATVALDDALAAPTPVTPFNPLARLRRMARRDAPSDVAPAAQVAPAGHGDVEGTIGIDPGAGIVTGAPFDLARPGVGPVPAAALPGAPWSQEATRAVPKPNPWIEGTLGVADPPVFPAQGGRPAPLAAVAATPQAEPRPHHPPPKPEYLGPTPLPKEGPAPRPQEAPIPEPAAASAERAHAPHGPEAPPEGQEGRLRGRALLKIFGATEPELASHWDQVVGAGTSLKLEDLVRSRDILHAVSDALVHGDDGAKKRLFAAWQILWEAPRARK